VQKRRCRHASAPRTLGRAQTSNAIACRSSDGRTALACAVASVDRLKTSVSVARPVATGARVHHIPPPSRSAPAHGTGRRRRSRRVTGRCEVRCWPTGSPRVACGAGPPRHQSPPLCFRIKSWLHRQRIVYGQVSARAGQYRMRVALLDRRQSLAPAASAHSTHTRV